MTRFLQQLTAVIALAAAVLGREDIDCNNWNDETIASGQQHFHFIVHAEHWTRGSQTPVEVELVTKSTSDKQIKGFLIQAHDVLDNPIGTFMYDPNNIHSKLHQCTNSGDTMINADGMMSTRRVSVRWLPPTTYVPSGYVDFNAAVVTMDSGKTVTLNGIRSNTITHMDEVDTIAVEEDSTEEEVDEQAEHERIIEESRRKETEDFLKHQDEIKRETELEDRESEGDWVREREEEREREEKEREDEERQYELDMAEEQAKRQQMMELEIKDKIEHDRLMAEQEKNKIPAPNSGSSESDEFDEDDEEIVLTGDEGANISDGSGASSLAFSFLTLITCILARF